MQNQPPEPNYDASEDSEDRKVTLQHSHNYIGGPYAYKNSSKKGKLLDPIDYEPIVLTPNPGQASVFNMAMPEEDRVGQFPQHNTVIFREEEIVDEYNDPGDDADDFVKNLELLPSRNLKPYENLTRIKMLNESKFERRTCTMTKSRLDRIRSQFSHLSPKAFNQMLNITRPDVRDFTVWHKTLAKSRQLIFAYPDKASKLTLFVQVIQYAEDGTVASIKHCSFADGEPLVINETTVDKFNNVRQIAHLGAKGGGENYNSVERFDDGTVCWIVTNGKETGAAALKPDNEIVFVGNLMNDSAKLAARNLGAEGVKNGKWNGSFAASACKAKCLPIQEAFRQKTRAQLNQIVDGSSIPGLDPIFWL